MTIRSPRRGYGQAAVKVLNGTAAIADAYVAGAAGKGTLKQLHVSWNTLVAAVDLEIRDGASGSAIFLFPLAAGSLNSFSIYPDMHFDTGAYIAGLSGASGTNLHIVAIYEEDG